MIAMAWQFELAESGRDAFERFYERYHVPASERALIENWIEGGLSGSRPSAPTPSRSDDTKRLAEIREARKSNPDGYDHDREIQIEEFEIIERLQSAPIAASSPKTSG